MYGSDHKPMFRQILSRPATFCHAAMAGMVRQAA